MQAAGVEVWTARPQTLGEDDCQRLEALLDDDERHRAGCLQQVADRRAWCVAHALQRIALGAALGAEPDALRLDAAPNGRPRLRCPPDMADEVPAFSLTHCREFVACALSRAGAVGVDVEPVRDGVVPALLEPWMRPLPGEGLTLFYRQWTALEAYRKACGMGLSDPHPRIALALRDDGGMTVLHAQGDRPTGLVTWQLPAPDGLVLTLACSPAAPVRLLDLQGLGPQPGGSGRTRSDHA